VSGLATGTSFSLPSFLFPLSPHLCLQWACSLRHTYKPDSFEARPIFIPWRHKMTYERLDDQRCRARVGRSWFFQQRLQPSQAPRARTLHRAPVISFRIGGVEHELAEMVTDNPATNGVVRGTPTPTTDATPEQQHPRVPNHEPAVEAIRETCRCCQSDRQPQSREPSLSTRFVGLFAPLIVVLAHRRQRERRLGQRLDPEVRCHYLTTSRA
jgi:hypothetical protein